MSWASRAGPTLVHVFDLTGPIFGERGLQYLRQHKASYRAGAEGPSAADIRWDMRDQGTHRLDMVELVEADARFGSGTELDELPDERQSRLKLQLYRRAKAFWLQNPLNEESAMVQIEESEDPLTSTRIRLYRVERAMTKTAAHLAQHWNHAYRNSFGHQGRLVQPGLVDQSMLCFFDYLLEILDLQEAVYEFFRTMHTAKEHAIPDGGSRQPTWIKVFDFKRSPQTSTRLKRFETCLADLIVAWLLPATVDFRNEFYQKPEHFEKLLCTSMTQYRHKYGDITRAIPREEADEDRHHAMSNAAFKAARRLEPSRIFPALVESLAGILSAWSTHDEAQVQEFEQALKPFISEQRAAAAKLRPRH